MTPHIRNKQQFPVSVCLLYCFFIKDALVSCLLPPPPPFYSSCRIRNFCCSDSRCTIGDRTNPCCPCEGTTASLMATCPSLQNVPQSCMPSKFDKVEGMLVEKRLCMFILACFLFLCIYLWGFLSTLHQCILFVESSAPPDVDKSNNQP